jgi:cation diffusion facilitator CzcD-associated flavoprotein CzcO
VFGAKGTLTFFPLPSAVIGIGSSGLQTVGAITPYTKNVSVFARSKFWASVLLDETCRYAETNMSQVHVYRSARPC